MIFSLSIQKIICFILVDTQHFAMNFRYEAIGKPVLHKYASQKPNKNIRTF